MGLEPDPRQDPALFLELFPVGQDALEKCGLPRGFQGTQSLTAQPPEADFAMSQEPCAPDLSPFLGRLGQFSFLAPWALLWLGIASWFP